MTASSYARRRTWLFGAGADRAAHEAMAAEPVDAPYTFSDLEGAAAEARRSRCLGYRTKSLVRPEHVAAVRDAIAPTAAEREHARRVAEAFEAARARGEDRALVDGLWIEVPTYLNARRLLQDG